jgi:hypothetical protein
MLVQLPEESTLSLLEALGLVDPFATKTVYSLLAASRCFARTQTLSQLLSLLQQLLFESAVLLSIRLLQVDQAVTQVAHSGLLVGQLSFRHRHLVLRGFPLPLARTIGNWGGRIPIVAVEIGALNQVADA